ncbi:hypothetical protein ACLESO_16575 [Pyxidicoccus sp. 3LG]
MNPRSSPSLTPVALLTAAALLLGGCTKEESAPTAPGGGDDRTLRKLREEVDRVNQGGRPTQGPESTRGDPNANLAGLAAGLDEAAERQLALPADNSTVHVDTLAVKLTGLESSHSVKGSGKVSLTTEELFFRVQLITQNVGAAPLSLDLDGAKVVGATGQQYTVARDAQAVAGTRPLRRSWAPEERSDVVLLFELPPAALREDGLQLVLQGSGGDVRIPLR